MTKKKMYTVEAKSLPGSQIGWITIQKVDGKVEISLGEGAVAFTTKEAREIVSLIKKCIVD